MMFMAISLTIGYESAHCMGVADMTNKQWCTFTNCKDEHTWSASMDEAEFEEMEELSSEITDEVANFVSYILDNVTGRNVERDYLEEFVNRTFRAEVSILLDDWYAAGVIA